MPVSKSRKLADLRSQEQRLALKLALAKENEQDELKFTLGKIREKIISLSD